MLKQLRAPTARHEDKRAPREATFVAKFNSQASASTRCQAGGGAGHSCARALAHGVASIPMPARISRFGRQYESRYENCQLGVLVRGGSRQPKWCQRPSSDPCVCAAFPARFAAQAAATAVRPSLPSGPGRPGDGSSPEVQSQESQERKEGRGEGGERKREDRKEKGVVEWLSG